MNEKTSKTISRLDVYDADSKELNVIIETPKGSRNKFAFDEKLGLFKLKGVLPAGANFPYDFGFIPSTLGEDGDPLDVLVLMDEPAFSGCLVPSRLIGVIEAEQTERDGETVRNDRLVAIGSNSVTHRGIDSLEDLNENIVKEIEHFFISYNEIKGKQFKPIGRFGAERARCLIQIGVNKFQDKEKNENKP